MKEFNLFNLEDLPILYNLNFGHTEPKFILPCGAMAEINCDTKTFTILDSGVE
jgi:muramoyltetrapeptide carboxypeptidase LdcA involved in peptidoglycan recycling